MVPAECILSVSGEEIRYRVNRSAQRKKTMQITVRPPGEVLVSVPRHYSDQVVEDFLKKKSTWILKKLRFFKNYSAQHLEPNEDRKGCMYLGKFCLVNCIETPGRWGRIFFEQDRFTIHVPSRILAKERTVYVRNFLLKWYKARAAVVLAERVKKYSQVIGVHAEEMHIRSPRRLWGSCHPVKRTLHFNWKILMAPLETLDYIVVHELCHIRVPNHSKKFWELVQSYVADFKGHHAWLKFNGHRLKLP